jgi:hypothetical protein
VGFARCGEWAILRNFLLPRHQIGGHEMRRIPGFAAEASLYSAHEQYYTAERPPMRGGVMPAQFDMPGPDGRPLPGGIPELPGQIPRIRCYYWCFPECSRVCLPWGPCFYFCRTVCGWRCY